MEVKDIDIRKALPRGYAKTCSNNLRKQGVTIEMVYKCASGKCDNPIIMSELISIAEEYQQLLNQVKAKKQQLSKMMNGE